MSETSSLPEIIRAQWENPEDIFSLLLLVGGETIQRAIARLVGFRIGLPLIGINIYLTPIGFSFGWVAYAFLSLAAVAGECRLMPEADTSIQVINIDDGYVRENNSWVLGRLIRDNEDRVRKAERISDHPSDSTGNISHLIDIFVLEKREESGPSTSWTWWICWLLIPTQLFISAVLFFHHDNWSIFLITSCGTVLGLITASLPQWTEEKWCAGVIPAGKCKTVALTRGNGHQYIMVISGHQGAWDLEAMASSRLHAKSETRLILVVLCVLWVVLLITVTGLKKDTWFLILVGVIGMVQNVIVGAMPCSAKQFNIPMKESTRRATITGYQYESNSKHALKLGAWKSYTPANAKTDFPTKLEEPKVRDVMGALMELEKYHKKAGIALVPIFFPGSIDYKSGAFRNLREKLFWEYADRKKQKEEEETKRQMDKERQEANRLREEIDRQKEEINKQREVAYKFFIF